MFVQYRSPWILCMLLCMGFTVLLSEHSLLKAVLATLCIHSFIRFLSTNMLCVLLHFHVIMECKYSDCVNYFFSAYNVNRVTVYCFASMHRLYIKRSFTVLCQCIQCTYSDCEQYCVSACIVPRVMVYSIVSVHTVYIEWLWTALCQCMYCT